MTRPIRLLSLGLLILATSGAFTEARATGSGDGRGAARAARTGRAKRTTGRAGRSARQPRSRVGLRTQITGSVNNTRDGRFSGVDVGEMEVAHSSRGGAAKKGVLKLRFTHSPSFPGGDFDLQADVRSDRTRTYKTGTRTRTVRGKAADGTDIRVSKTSGGRRDGVLRVETATPTATRSFEAFP
jgi:hypothetical protein